MPVEFDEKNPGRWESKKDKYKIQRGFRAYTVEEIDGRKFRPYVEDPDRNVELYHCYDDDEYVGFHETFKEAASGINRRDEKKKKDKKDKK